MDLMNRKINIFLIAIVFVLVSLVVIVRILFSEELVAFKNNLHLYEEELKLSFLAEKQNRLQFLEQSNSTRG